MAETKIQAGQDGVPRKQQAACEPEAFDCKMCGHCCLGEGGIVVSPKDLVRIAAHMNMTPQAFAAEHGVYKGGKLFIRAGADGYCIFFEEGKGCGVHVAKPDICRAWPFFRGNVVDAESLELAKEYCPGIRSDVPHAEFARQGRAYLKENGLIASDPACEARALILDDN